MHRSSMSACSQSVHTQLLRCCFECLLPTHFSSFLIRILPCGANVSRTFKSNFYECFSRTSPDGKMGSPVSVRFMQQDEPVNREFGSHEAGGAGLALGCAGGGNPQPWLLLLAAWPCPVPCASISLAVIPPQKMNTVNRNS